MMMFSVYDSISNRYTVPFPATTPGAAERAFSQAVNGGDKQMSASPQDFSLVCVGAFDDVTGMFTPQEPQRLAMGTQVRNVG